MCLLSTFEIGAHTVDTLKDVTKVQLSSQEKVILSKRKYIVGITDYPPFIFFNSAQNDFDGVSYEYLQLISKKTGIKFEYKVFSNLNDVITATAKGEIDIAFNVNNIVTAVDKSEPYFVKTARLVVRRQLINDWEKIFTNGPDSKVIIANVRGTGISQITEKSVLSTDAVHVNTPVEALVKVAFSEADYAIMDISQFGYYQSKFESSKLAIAKDSNTLDIISSFGFAPRLEPVVKNVINRTILELSPQEIEFVDLHWRAFAYKEPLLRTEFVILLLVIALIVIINCIWYFAWSVSIKNIEKSLDAKWINAFSKTIENEKKIIRAQLDCAKNIVTEDEKHI